MEKKSIEDVKKDIQAKIVEIIATPLTVDQLQDHVILKDLSVTKLDIDNLKDAFVHYSSFYSDKPLIIRDFKKAHFDIDANSNISRITTIVYAQLYE